MAYAPKPASCWGCPAYTKGISYVPGTGPLTARYALIGQGPGEVEAHAHRPFVGPSGNKLDRWLTKAGLRRHEAWVDNVVRCWLPGNRKPTTAEAAYCTQAHLFPSLKALTHLEVTVSIGVPAMAVLVHPRASERTAGTCIQTEVPW